MGRARMPIGGENIKAEVTAQTPIIADIAENFGVEITTPTGTNKQILQGNNANLESIKTNAKKAGKYVWKKQTSASGDFICFVTSDNETEYPNGGIHTDGYFYIRISSTGQPILFDYTGTYNFKTEIDETVNALTWELQLLTSGILTIDEVVTPINDIFLVGGGGGGAAGTGYTGLGGGGGGGGYTLSQLSTQIPTGQECEVIIGAGGAKGQNWNTRYPDETFLGKEGGNTSIFGFTAKGGDGGTVSNGGNGGSGGGSSGGQSAVGTPGTGQGTTTRAFGEPTGTLYAGGGGGGLMKTTESEWSHVNGGNGGVDGSNGTEGIIITSSTYTAGTGGAGGGGNGGSGGGNVSKGEPNTGGGGGGGFGYSYTAGGDHGADGGSGIIILRGRYS